MTKYGARKTVCAQGHKHSSAKEAKHCHDLHIRQRLGEIVGLQVEPKYTFIVNGAPVKMGNGAAMSYKPDFEFVENGVKTCLDVKGGSATKTEAFAIRWALAKHCWPEIEWRMV